MTRGRIYTLGFENSDLLHHIDTGGDRAIHVEKRRFGRYRVWFQEPLPEPQPVEPKPVLQTLDSPQSPRLRAEERVMKATTLAMNSPDSFIGRVLDYEDEMLAIIRELTNER